VILVTPLVKPVRPPRILDENEETLLTTEAAKVEPGIEGIDTRPPREPGDVGIPIVEVDVPIVGLETVGS
jgi:hypothetical protein